MNDSRDENEIKPKRERNTSMASFTCNKPRRLSEYQHKYDNDVKLSVFEHKQNFITCMYFKGDCEAVWRNTNGTRHTVRSGPDESIWLFQGIVLGEHV